MICFWIFLAPPPPSISLLFDSTRFQRMRLIYLKMMMNLMKMMRNASLTWELDHDHTHMLIFNLQSVFHKTPKKSISPSSDDEMRDPFERHADSPFCLFFVVCTTYPKSPVTSSEITGRMTNMDGR